MLTSSVYFASGKLAEKDVQGMNVSSLPLKFERTAYCLGEGSLLEALLQQRPFNEAVVVTRSPKNSLSCLLHTVS